MINLCKLKEFLRIKSYEKELYVIVVTFYLLLPTRWTFDNFQNFKKLFLIFLEWNIANMGGVAFILIIFVVYVVWQPVVTVGLVVPPVLLNLESNNFCDSRCGNTSNHQVISEE